MSNFNDLLNKPLPSQVNEEVNELFEQLEADVNEKMVQEGTEDNMIPDLSASTNGPEAEECGSVVSEELDDLAAPAGDDSQVNMDDIEDIGDGEDDDIDDLSDADLAALDAELSGETINDLVAAGNEDEVKLSPSEEMDADDMMNVAATTMLVNDELNTEEKVAFLQNEAEVRTVINEGFMTESDVNLMANDLGLVEESKYNNRMIVRLSLAAKKEQLYALAVNVSAAAHNDRDYIKLKKVMKMRKILRAKLRRKYNAEAMKRAKIYLRRLMTSKSGTMQKIAKNHMDKKK